MEVKDKSLTVLDMVNKLQKDSNLKFNNGKISNITAIHLFVKSIKRVGHKTINRAIVEAMIKKEAGDTNVFGVLYLTQFCVHWDQMFPGVFEIHMGQVDRIMRTYYA